MTCSRMTRLLQDGGPHSRAASHYMQTTSDEIADDAAKALSDYPARSLDLYVLPM